MEDAVVKDLVASSLKLLSSEGAVTLRRMKTQGVDRSGGSALASRVEVFNPGGRNTKDSEYERTIQDKQKKHQKMITNQHQ